MNLVSVLGEVLPLQCEKQLAPHVLVFTRCLVRQSTTQPLVSSHYTALTTLLSCAQRTHYFNKQEVSGCKCCFMWKCGHQFIEYGQCYSVLKVESCVKEVVRVMVENSGSHYFSLFRDIYLDNINFKKRKTWIDIYYFSYRYLFQDPEVETTVHLLTGYIRELVERCRQYRDHLLASCLTLILSLPPRIVINIFPELITPMQVLYLS